jgi:hypothetical protein
MGTEQHAESGVREAQPEPAHEHEHEYEPEQGENGKDQAETKR